MKTLPTKWQVKLDISHPKYKEFVELYNKHIGNYLNVTSNEYYYTSCGHCIFLSYCDYKTISMDDFIAHYTEPKALPEKWAVKLDINHPKYKEFREIYKKQVYFIAEVNFDNCYYKSDWEDGVKSSLPEGYTLITMDEVINFYTQKTEIMEKMDQYITRENLREIVNIACDNWRKKLAAKAEDADVFSNVIEFTNVEVEEMFKEATKEQLPVVEKYFKRPIKEDTLNGIKGNRSHFMADGYNETSMIALRAYGKYKDAGYYLNSKFNWSIEQEIDDDKCFILIPKKK